MSTALSPLLAPMLSSPAMRAICDDMAYLQYMLDFEAALARAALTGAALQQALSRAAFESVIGRPAETLEEALPPAGLPRSRESALAAAALCGTVTLSPANPSPFIARNAATASVV